MSYKFYTMKKLDKAYINGKLVPVTGYETFDLINPANGEQIGKLVLGNEIDAEKAIQAAKEAFRSFSKISTNKRKVYLQRFYDAVKSRKEEFISSMVEEFGCPVQFANLMFEQNLIAINTNISLLDSYEFLQKVGVSYVIMQPVGVVGIITPWNASNTFICNKLSTAIAAGCTVVIKPSEMSGFQTEVMLECIAEAGFPPGVVNLVNGLGKVVGNAFTTSPDISKISFTGSTEVGREIARNATVNFKRLTLELGGKSPNIILDDANLDDALNFSVPHAFFNSGQGCIAGTRLLVPASKMEEVKEKIKNIVSFLKIGNPNDSSVNIGPMVSQKQYERVQEYIQLGIDEGATLLVGGLGKPEGLDTGYFVKPTVFVNVKNSMRIAQEEIFGPVLCVISYQDDEEAITIANDVQYGLASYVQSSNVDRAKEIAERLEAGYIMINGFKPDPLAPFGGLKQSGIGREFGVNGLLEYLETKSILV